MKTKRNLRPSVLPLLALNPGLVFLARTLRPQNRSVYLQVSAMSFSIFSFPDNSAPPISIHELASSFSFSLSEVLSSRKKFSFLALDYLQFLALDLPSFVSAWLKEIY